MISLKNKIVKVAIKISLGVSFFVGLHLIARKVVFNPLNAERERLEIAQEELKETEELIREYPNPKKNIEEIKAKREDLEKRAVNAEKELPRIIQELTRKSSELNIEIISIRPIKEATFKEIALPDGVSKAYLEIVLKTSYMILGDYLKALKELPIIFTLEGISIERFEAMGEADSRKATQKGKIIARVLISSYTVLKM